MTINYKSDYLTKHLITYLGNKRGLLPFIDSAVNDIKKELKEEHPTMFDGFSGSGCVARLFKHYASELFVNDYEGYAETINRCYLANKSEIDVARINYYIDKLNNLNLTYTDGFIRKNYSPKDDKNILQGERTFYTNKNALIIDNIRKYIKEIVEKENPLLVPYVLAPLITKASINVNTAASFKGFYKNKAGIGQFGGEGKNALKRIISDITLDYPVFCNNECEYTIYKGDTNAIIKKMPEVDIVYYDPPYNQHPYGSNYFMLNIINDYEDSPQIQEGVAGISKDWNKSDYNKRREAGKAMEELIENTKAKYILVSYNNEGIIPENDFKDILEKYGKISKKTQEHNTFRASKNTGKGKTLLNGETRKLKVEEILWILKKD